MSLPSSADRILVGRSGDVNQGPFYIVTVQVRDELVVKVSCRTLDCFWASSIGAMAGAMVEGRPIEVCRHITEAALLERLVEVPRAKRDLLGMVCSALRQAAESEMVVDATADPIPGHPLIVS